MGEIKTKVTKESVEAYLNAVKDETKRKDAFVLLNMLRKITKQEPRLWGNGTIGFGVFSYKSARSAQQGEWYLAGFSPRASNLTVYIMPGFVQSYKKITDKLGKFKTGGGCLYINKLADVDLKALGELMETSYSDIKKMIIENKSAFGQTALGPKSDVSKTKSVETKSKPVKKTTTTKTIAKKAVSKTKSKSKK